MGIIDELAEETGYRPAKQEEGKAFRPSSYNPLHSFPENLGHNLRGAGSEIMKGAEQIEQGDLLSGAFHTGMGALEGVYSPLEAGVQTATQPLSDATGVPDWLLTGAAMLPLGYKSLAGGARRMMGIGGAEAGAAPMAEAMGKVEPRIGATNREEWQRSYGERKRAYEEGVAGRRGAQMEEAAGRTPPVSPAERFFPEEGPKLLPQFGKGEPVYRMPNESVAPMKETYAEGYRPGGQAEQMMFGPDRMLPPPAIRLPDQRPKWSKPQSESGILMPGIGRRPEEIAASMGQRRMSPEQQIPDYTLGTFASRAAEQSGQMRGEREAFKEAGPKLDYGSRGAKQIKPAEGGTPPSMGKEEKLQTPESEGVRSLYDAVRTLETSGMGSAEAEKHILNNIRAGHMTAVKPSGAPLTAKEAKKLRSLKGLGGVSWVRG